MIRSDREVTDFNDILSIIDRCDICRLGLNDPEGYPYILPLNFGYTVEANRLTLLFHGSLQGKKHDLMRADNRASFEMDCSHQLGYNAERGYCTMNYESVMGRGRIEYIEDEQERLRALTLLTDRMHPEGHFDFSLGALPRTTVFKLIVAEMTAKRKNSKI